MEFSDFSSHYCNLSDSEIVEDVKKSVNALIVASPEGECFGAKMVRKANEMAARKSEIYRQNVNLRWHPKEESTKDNEKHGNQDKFVAPSIEDIYDFASLNGLDHSDARDWYDMTVVDRGCKDKSGNPIANWKGAVKRFCQSRERGRNGKR